MKWTVDDSRLVYGVGRRDLDFLDITSDGDLCLKLGSHQIALDQVIQQAHATFSSHGYTRTSSFTLRVPQLISAQVARFQTTFDEAIKREQYRGRFRMLYPLKANPSKLVIQAVLAASPTCGLEVGTRWELSLALNELAESQPRVIMCNGVKDGGYIDTIRTALQRGHQVIVSTESATEAKGVLEGLPRDRLQLALRVKPYAALESHWSQAGGRHSKFGLGIHELTEVVELLKANHAETSVIAVHAHPGSQVLGDLSAFTQFLARIYVYVRECGLGAVRVVDVGGGLPVNYDGHLTTNTFRDYARAVVKAFANVVGSRHPQPDIMTESGRAVTAQHAFLVVKILDLHRIFPGAVPGEEEGSELSKKDAIGSEGGDDAAAILEAWARWRDQPPSDESVDERLRYELRSGLLKALLRRKLVHGRGYEDHLGNPLAQDLLRPEYILVGDFSVFSGAIDHVLAGQYFPILPITHLNRAPSTLVRLADITCDSDGEISAYAPPIARKRLFTQDGFPLTTTQPRQWVGFPIGNLDDIVGSYLVIALVGAYQDSIRMDARVMKALPNVELRVNPDGTWVTRCLEPKPAQQGPQ